MAANNIIALNKEHDVFDSKKKIKIATAESAASKAHGIGCVAHAQLTVVQRRVIEANHCLLLLHANLGDVCRQQCDEMEKQYPDRYGDGVFWVTCSDVPALVRAALLRHSKSKDTQLAALKVCPLRCGA